MILSIPTAVILEFFRHIDVDSDGEVEVEESVTKDDSIKYKAVSTVGGYRNAFTALYNNMCHMYFLEVNCQNSSVDKREQLLMKC